jgi:hypothetical protein
MLKVLIIKFEETGEVFMASMTGAEFAQKLTDGELKTQLTLLGMVKKGENPNHILFSRVCDRWTTIPTSIIENVDVLGKVLCKEHTHVLARLYIAEPQSEEASIFGELLRQFTEETISSSSMAPGMIGNMEATEPTQQTSGDVLQPFALPTNCSSGFGWCENGYCYVCCNGTWYRLGYYDSRGVFVHYTCSEGRGKSYKCGDRSYFATC